MRHGAATTLSETTPHRLMGRPGLDEERRARGAVQQFLDLARQIDAHARVQVLVVANELAQIAQREVRDRMESGSAARGFLLPSLTQCGPMRPCGKARYGEGSRTTYRLSTISSVITCGFNMP